MNYFVDDTFLGNMDHIKLQMLNKFDIVENIEYFKSSNIRELIWDRKSLAPVQFPKWNITIMFYCNYSVFYIQNWNKKNELKPNSWWNSSSATEIFLNAFLYKSSRIYLLKLPHNLVLFNIMAGEGHWGFFSH